LWPCALLRDTVDKHREEDAPRLGIGGQDRPIEVASKLSLSRLALLLQTLYVLDHDLVTALVEDSLSLELV